MGDTGDVSPRLRQDLFARLEKNRAQILWTGIGMAIIGVGAIVFPFVFSLSLTLLVGWLFIIAGAVSLYGSFSYHGTGPFFGALLLSLLQIGAGFFVVFNPGSGLVALTLMIAVVFMIEGAFKMMLAFEMKPENGWVWTMISALVSTLAGILIAAGLPGSSAIVLGLLMGVSFLSTGIYMIMLARRFKSK
jgi:uncharacterized membrane protein HdeD (DUF308 family)